MKRKIILKFMLILLPLAAFTQEDKIDSILQESEFRTFEKGGNIFVAFTDGTEKQLTFTQKDEKPTLSKVKNQVIFLRNETLLKSGGEYTRKKIMKVGINTYIEETITDQKPFKDGLENTYDILHVENPTLSRDENFLYFITNHTATSNILIKLDLQNGKWNELFSAELFELLKSGPFENHFIIARKEVATKGGGLFYYLVDETGNKLKEFANEESVQQFKNSFE
ncbi:MAG: hypothetical protein AMS27_02405 [Bacteroides sp. SM23_62_1]|nr:MAG: hypothetical protein AMS27_02405 [Bacteroides sp. SM23_62_1]